MSRRRGACALHVDIGGGTTKLALIDKGEIVSVAAFAVGGRLIAQDAQWRVDAGRPFRATRRQGAWRLPTTPEQLANERRPARAIARRLATLAVDQIAGAPLDELGRALELTEPLARTVKPDFISFSGGVAEYIFGRETAGHGDIAKFLAEEIIAQFKARISIPIIEPSERIRATVIGASQFTVQVSGKTIYLPDPGVLPVHNVPVVHLGLDLSGDIDADKIAAAFANSAALIDLASERPAGARLRLRRRAGISAACRHGGCDHEFAAPSGRRDELLVLMIDGDVGRGLGRIIEKELRLDGKLVSIDGVQLRELDYVDIGGMLDPPGVVPVVIKSLLFS